MSVINHMKLVSPKLMRIIVKFLIVLVSVRMSATKPNWIQSL